MTLTVEQVSERLALTPRHVRDLLVDGTLPGFKRGKRVWGVLLAELDRFISSRGNRPKAGGSSK